MHKVENFSMLHPLSPVPDVVANKILAAVEAGFAEQLRMTQELIRYPSERTQEHTAQEWVYRELTNRGYRMDRWVVNVEDIQTHPAFSPVTVCYDNAVNVVGTMRPREERGRTLILNGHIDVVPTGPRHMWSSPPYEPRVADGWLYGRGSGDMKAGLIANIAAVDALKRAGYQPAATIYQQSVTEEECTGNGTLACLVRGYEADAAICPEPEDDMLVRADVGVMWFQIQVRGRPVHVREAGTGSNAILSAYRIVQAIYELAEKWNGQKQHYRYFSDVVHPINCNVGVIRGGDWASSVPAWCNVDVRLAMYPGDRAVDRQKEIEACVLAAAAQDGFLADSPPKVIWTGSLREGYLLEEGCDAEAVLSRAHQRAFGIPLRAFVTPGTLDGVYFAVWQGKPCLTYGPYAENIHGYDERVRLDSVRRVTGAIALFIAEWCGLEAASQENSEAGVTVGPRENDAQSN
jgi:acetylornithine deacetylase